jgi:hypothetical protein
VQKNPEPHTYKTNIGRYPMTYRKIVILEPAMVIVVAGLTGILVVEKGKARVFI